MENGLDSSALSFCLDFHTNTFSTDRTAFQIFLLYVLKKRMRVAQPTWYSKLAKNY